MKIQYKQILSSFFLMFAFVMAQGQTEQKKVFIHYMGWYSSDSTGRHWGDGHVRTPIIGYYNSKNVATQMYHILLSWSCGIDGLVINVKDDYDDGTLRKLINTFNRIHNIDSTHFKYAFSISYDDQGMASIATTEAKFKCLKDTILPTTTNFLQYNSTPTIFIWNYKDPNPYLSGTDYNTALNAVFTVNKPKVLWNEIEAPEIANSYYPWVQGFSSDGLNWGKAYLAWYYPALASTSGLDFATGGVWAGFDDRSCSWGSQRWIDRQNGSIYDSTWQYINSYSGVLALKWVYIETWNDWNEGTEIEPSTQDGYKYLKSTIQNIGKFKDITINPDTCKFEAARKIYLAADSIEKGRRDSVVFNPYLNKAIKYFILDSCEQSITASNGIINGVCTKVIIGSFSRNRSEIDICYKVIQGELSVILPSNLIGFGTLQLLTCTGRLVMERPVKNRVEIFDITHLSKNAYILGVKSNRKLNTQIIVAPE
jgi:hypothetical protein